MRDKVLDASSRLRAWIRDFGAEKQPDFIKDLTTVLDEIKRLQNLLKEPHPSRDFVNECNELLAAKDKLISELRGA